MKIKHYAPDGLMRLWEKYSKNEFVELEDCDIVYVGTVSKLMEAVRDIFTKRINKPIVCWVWDLPVNWRSWCRGQGDLMKNMHRDSIISTYLNGLIDCDLVISASKYTQSVLEMFGQKSEQMYFYIDTEDMDTIPEMPKKNKIIQISRFALNKRFDLTLKAWRKIQDDYKDWELMFIGLGENNLEEMADDLGVERFTLLKDVPRYTTLRNLKESKILVSPSVFEGWGISPIEARYYGASVVMAKTPVCYEAVDPNEGLRDFEKDSLVGYSDVLGSLIDSYGKGLRVETAIKPGFTAKAFAERWDKLIEEKMG